jgi:dihydroorotate dehydrogenase
LLFKLDPETVHRWTLALLRAVGGFAPARALVSALYAAPPKPVVAFGLMFRNPVGLAAGYDKDGLGWCGLAALGFGHIEVGTITVRPQPGNPKPRVFRLPEDDGLINRLGFPGLGMEIVAAEMSRRCPSGVMLGANLGKNKDTPNEEAAQDYVTLMERFAPLADYLVVNVSSPNTVGLRRLQARDALETLLAHLARHRAEYLPDSHIPVLVKLAPDLDEAELDDALDVILRTGMDGVIATNTTLARENLRSPRAGETGGLSGAPLTEMSYAMLQSIVKRLDGALPVVSVGGIMSAEDAKMRLDAGAALVQVYTGLIYRGPGFVRDIVRAC